MVRKNKSSSFRLDNEFELGLLKHAEKPEHGLYSHYIKRLIHDDKRRSEGARVDVVNQVPSIVEVKRDFNSFI